MRLTRVAAVVDSPEERPRPPLTAAAVVAGIGLAGASAAITYGTTASAAAALGRGLIVAAPVCVGAYAWHHRPHERFGLLLMLTGFGWFVANFAESDDAVLYSIGRTAGWVLEVALVYLVLSFPTGRLSGRVDRALVGAGVAVVVLLYLPSAFLTDGYPVPSPASSCESGCPGNAFLLVASEPAWVDSALRPLREALTVLIFAAVLVRLALRIRGATPLMRRTLNPVLVVAIARLALLLTAIVVRAAAPDSPVTTALVWAAALALPALAISFGVGLIRQRLLVADAVEGLGQRIRDGLPARDLGKALSTALDDPSLRLIYPAPGTVPDPGRARHVTEVEIGDRLAALVVHDSSLLGQPRLLRTVVTLVRMALENERLSGEVAASLAEIAASRGRIQAAADDERRRIERDLHDGAQQRLVALRVKLALTEELVREDPERGLLRLHSLGDDVTATLEDVRSLAGGVYPALLAERGLPDALRAAARSSPSLARVEPDGIERYPQEVESAVYFSCLEALQNAGKHAPGATVTIQLREDDWLRFEVRDDGDGFDVEEYGKGAGLTNMRDRIEAIGGRLSIRSTPGAGSVVSGSVPRARRAGAPAPSDGAEHASPPPAGL